MQRESTGWPPLVFGLFDGTEQAELAMSGLIERLAKLDWGGFRQRVTYIQGEPRVRAMPSLQGVSRLLPHNGNGRLTR